MVYLCSLLVIVILFLIIKIIKLTKQKNYLKMTLTDFQPILDSLNSSLSSITSYVASLSAMTGGLSAADATTLQSNMSTLASSFASIVPVVPTSPIVGPGTVAVGSTISLTDATAGGTWSSSDSSIATVDASGNVTGVAAGTAVITYSPSTGSSVVLTVIVA